MNPMNMIKQYITQGLSPQNILSKMNINNPILNNVINMAQNGDTKGVETFARNICKQKGLDFDTEFNKFKSTFDK
jgi:hypothetical protein